MSFSMNERLDILLFFKDTYQKIIKKMEVDDSKYSRDFLMELLELEDMVRCPAIINCGLCYLLNVYLDRNYNLIEILPETDGEVGADSSATPLLLKLFPNIYSYSKEIPTGDDLYWFSNNINGHRNRLKAIQTEIDVVSTVIKNAKNI